MRWKTQFYEQKYKKNNSKNAFGLKSDKALPPFNELESFEKGLLKLVPKIEFQKLSCEFQKKLNMTIKNIKASTKPLKPVGNTSNIYNLTKEKDKPLLLNSTTETYKKTNPNVQKSIMEQGKKIANKKRHP